MSDTNKTDDGMLTLSLDRKKVPVQLGPRLFHLVEMCGSERDDYLEFIATKQNAAGSGLRSYKDIQADLVRRCLDDGSGIDIDIKFFQQLPATTLAKLYEVAADLNGMTPDSQEKLKKA